MNPKSNLDEIYAYCQNRGWNQFWMFTNIYLMVVGGTGNGATLWLLFRKMKSNSASKVLGVNLVLMDFMYIVFVPFACAFYPYSFKTNTTELEFTYNNSINVTGNIFEMFVLIGCPLLLTCMCIERYLAVVQPVLYLKTRKREYYMGVSSVVWIITFVFCLASGIINDLSVMLAPVCIVVCCLFFIMFASLMGVVLSLRQQSPACTSGDKTISPLKRQAVGNVLNVVIPAVITYMPVCVMIPCLFLTTYGPLELNQMLCYALQVCQMFPKYGVLIGPLFYLAKYKQIFCGVAKN